MSQWYRVRAVDVTIHDILAAVVGLAIFLTLVGVLVWQALKPAKPVVVERPAPTVAPRELPTTEEVGERVGRTGVKLGRGLVNGVREELAEGKK